MRQGKDPNSLWGFSSFTYLSHFHLVLNCFLAWGGGGGWGEQGHGFLLRVPALRNLSYSYSWVSVILQVRRDRATIENHWHSQSSYFKLPSVPSPSLESVHWGSHSGSTGELVLIILNQKMELSSSTQLIEDSCAGQVEQWSTPLDPHSSVSLFLGMCRHSGKGSHVACLLS